jgi:oxalate decarboxylase
MDYRLKVNYRKGDSPMKTIKKSDRQQSSEESAARSGPSVSRRMFAGAAALASAGFMSANAMAQTRAEQIAGRQGASPSDPGPENKTLLGQNPSANNPPFTDHGNPGPIWSSFDCRQNACRAVGGRAK